MEPNGKKIEDVQILIRFIQIFCREKHPKDSRKPFISPFEEMAPLVDDRLQLCESCSELLAYGMRRRLQCPHNPKPACKKCEKQCYSKEYRERIREVMKFSGPYLIKRGRLDLLYHYLT